MTFTLPAVAAFTTRDGLRFLMSIAGTAEQNRLQLEAIEGQPWMRSEDFANIKAIVYLDQCGRACQHFNRTVHPVLQA